MLKHKQSRVIRPFVQAHSATVAATQNKKLSEKTNSVESKETREVIVRVMDRVKRI